MGEFSKYFGGPEGAVPEYNQSHDAETFKRMLSTGVFASVLNELEAVETDPALLAVRINTGEACVEGFFYKNDDWKTMELDEADGSNPRIDRIVLRLDTITNFNIRLAVLKGEPAGSPSAPSLTQTSSIYEIAIAQINVGAGVTAIYNANITDERQFVNSNISPIFTSVWGAM